MLILATQMLLIGAGWFAVGLRNVDSTNRLVKIDALIAGDGMPDSLKVPQPDQNQEVNPEELPNEEDNDPDDVQPKVSTEIKVRVRGNTIFINDGVTPDSSFESRFSSIYDKSKQVILIDDYADYQVYSKLTNYFDESGIKIKEEQLQR